MGIIDTRVFNNIQHVQKILMLITEVHLILYISETKDILLANVTPRDVRMTI